MLTEVIASEAQERLRELNLANQLLAAVLCTSLALCLPMSFALLVLSTVWCCAFKCRFFMCRICVFSKLFGSWDAMGVTLAYLDAHLD